jgi:hypothetical protein
MSRLTIRRLDDRIQVAVVAAYCNDRAAILDSTEPTGMPDWRFPNSLRKFTHPNVAALVCPRPLQIQAGDHDQLFQINGARKVGRAVRQLYARLNVADRFSYFEFVGRAFRAQPELFVTSGAPAAGRANQP